MAHSTEELAALAEQWQNANLEDFQRWSGEALEQILASENPAELFRADLEGTDSEESEDEEVDMATYVDHVIAGDHPEVNILPQDEKSVLTLPDGTQLDEETAREFAETYFSRLRVWPGMPGSESMQPHEFEAATDELLNKESEDSKFAEDVIKGLDQWPSS